MTKIFLISDTHFNHKTMVNEKWRNFKSVEEMNQTIVRNWNKVVSKEDTVYHLGDVCIGGLSKFKKDILPILNGNITFIRGNHDSNSISNIKSIVLVFKGEEYELTHDPNESSGKVKNVIHGHQHKSGKDKPMVDRLNYFNVNLEYHNFKPVLINEVVGRMKNYSL